MKSTLLLILISATTCFAQTHSPQSTDFKKLEWLSGTWNRTNISKPGRTAHERWEKVAEQELRGYGVTMHGNDTAFVEKIKIVVKDKNIYYVADVPENKEPVYFKIVELTSTGFVCENPNHDFPKKISYQVNDTHLKAQISGDGKSIDYLFTRQQP